MAHYFDALGATLVWQQDNGTLGIIVSDALVEMQKAYEREGWTSLVASRAAERGYFLNGEPFTDHHVCSEEEMSTHPYYRDFRPRFRLGPVAGLAVLPDPRIGVGVSIQRALGQTRYSDAELEDLSAIGRHVEKALRLSVRLLDAELTKLELGQALARLGIGVIALDARGRVLFANPKAEALVGDGIDIVRGSLQIGKGQIRAAADQAISEVVADMHRAADAALKPILLERTDSKSPLVAYFLPVGRSARLSEDFLTHTRAIVLLLDPSIGEPADPAVVRDVLGLTLGEARIAALVGAGLAPKEAADRLRVSHETARKHLKSVFLKTGISRQSELSGLLARLVLHRDMPAS